MTMRLVSSSSSPSPAPSARVAVNLAVGRVGARAIEAEGTAKATRLFREKLRALGCADWATRYLVVTLVEPGLEAGALGCLYEPCPHAAPELASFVAELTFTEQGSGRMRLVDLCQP